MEVSPKEMLIRENKAWDRGYWDGYRLGSDNKGPLLGLESANGRPEMETKEMRKLLNAAWDCGDRNHWPLMRHFMCRQNLNYRKQVRHRDVTRILEAKKKEGRKEQP